MNESPTLSHSGLGIASLILSILVGVTEFVMVVAATIMDSASDGGMDEESIGAILVGLMILGGCFMALVGLALGIAGLVQKDRKKIFPALGTAFNAVVLLGVLGLLVIGLCLA